MEGMKNVGFQAFKEGQLRTLFFWDFALCHWVFAA
jgi:hypothetical protein